MKTIALFGSGEFTPAMHEVDAFLLSQFQKPRIAVLPTAAGQEHDWWKWVDQSQVYFKNIGYEAFGIWVQKRDDALNLEVASELDHADVVYLSGGDPGYLLHTLNDTPVWEKISQKTLVVGSSAGAMFLGTHLLSNIYQVFDEGEKSLAWEKASGVVPYTIWPHFDFGLQKYHDQWYGVMTQAPPYVKNAWLGIDEDTAAICQIGAKIKVIGKGKIHYGQGLSWHSISASG